MGGRGFSDAGVLGKLGIGLVARRAARRGARGWAGWLVMCVSFCFRFVQTKGVLLMILKAGKGKGLKYFQPLYHLNILLKRSASTVKAIDHESTP